MRSNLDRAIMGSTSTTDRAFTKFIESSQKWIADLQANEFAGIEFIVDRDAAGSGEDQ